MQVAELKALSRREGVTLFMTLLAAFQTLLSRVSGQEDIVVGTGIANRTRGEVEGLIGFREPTAAAHGPDGRSDFLRIAAAGAGSDAGSIRAPGRAV